MELTVFNTTGEEVKSIELPASIFEANVNVGLMHQALVRQLSNARRGTHKAKGRSEIARTTAKMYRQKGTGRARHGSRRAPIFVGGGVAHGPQPRDYSKKMPRKMRRAALRSALTVKASNGDVVMLDEITMDSPKTKEVAQIVDRLVGYDSALLLISGHDTTNVELSARNLSDVKALNANYLNIRDLLGYEKLILSVDALDVLIDFLGAGEELEMSEAPKKTKAKAVPKKAKEETPVVEAAEVEEAQAEEAAPSEVKADDLKRIEGIGPKTASVLNEGGITTFAQLADMAVDEIQAVLEGKVRVTVTDTWAEQAALAAAGKWDQLNDLQDELKGGRRS